MRNIDLRSLTGLRHSGRLFNDCNVTFMDATPEFIPVDEWDEWLTPIDDQGQTGTCVAQATTRIIETYIARFTGLRVQLDALAVYRRAWEIENRRPWKGDEGYADGLKIDAAVVALVDMGVLPVGTQCVEVPASPETISLALRKLGPLLAGTCVHEGWLQENMNKETGEIAQRPWLLNGHAWAIVGIGRGRGGIALVRGANSWGEDWGWHGFFQWAMPNFRSCCVTHPIAICPPGVPEDGELANRWRSVVYHRRSEWCRLVVRASGFGGAKRPRWRTEEGVGE